jgi:hypothetical protein
MICTITLRAHPPCNEIRNGFAFFKLLTLSLLRWQFHENTLFRAGSGKHYRKFFGVARN